MDSSFFCTSIFAILLNTLNISYCSSTKNVINETLVQELNTDNKVKNTLLSKKRMANSKQKLGIAQQKEVKKFFENPNNTSVFNLSKFIISSPQDVIYGKKCNRFIYTVSDKLPKFICKPLRALCGQNMSLPCDETDGTVHRGRHSSIFGSLLRTLLLRNCILDDDIHFCTKGEKNGEIIPYEYGCLKKMHTIDCLNSMLEEHVKLLQKGFNNNFNKLKNEKDFTKIQEISNAILEIRGQIGSQTEENIFERIRWSVDSQNKKSLTEFIEKTFLQPAEKFLFSINANEISNSSGNQTNSQQNINLSNGNQLMLINNESENSLSHPSTSLKLLEDFQEKETDLSIDYKTSFDFLVAKKIYQTELFFRNFKIKGEFSFFRNLDLKKEISDDQDCNYSQNFNPEY